MGIQKDGFQETHGREMTWTLLRMYSTESLLRKGSILSQRMKGTTC
jgi:hypothetical protein